MSAELMLDPTRLVIAAIAGLVILLVLIGAAVGMGTRNFIALTQLPPFYI